MKKLVSTKFNNTTRDPFAFKHNGLYYICYTEDCESLSVVSSKTVDGLSDAVGVKVYTAVPGSACSKELWAPELHVIDGKCYIYVAGDDGENRNHRMFVLTNDSSDPQATPYRMLGKITDTTDKWAIDGTIMHHGGKTYYIWSGWEGDENVCQYLYIAEMASPTSLKTERVMISKPEYDWEKLGSTGEPESPFINEGAFVFNVNGRTLLTYSAAGSWCTDYCIAALELVGDDPLLPGSWKKRPTPILSANDTVKGTGHCSVICDDDAIRVFFHAWSADEEKISWDTVHSWHAEMKINGDDITIE